MGNLRAAVVGAGAIGAALDTPGTATPLTHAGGYRAAGYDLVGLVDVTERAGSEAKRWGCQSFPDIAALLRDARPDVVSVCVPTSARQPILEELLRFAPKLIIAEKPLGESAAAAARIGEAFRAARIPLLVNYTRRFVPAWQGLTGSSAMSASIRYGKGIRHNGTHAIDLLHMLFGECRDARSLSVKADFWDDDPSVSAYLKFERCPDVFLQAMNERCFTLFEVDIVTPEARFVVDDDGRRLRRWRLRDGVGVPPGRRLMEEVAQSTGAEMAMRNLMNHARDVIAGAQPLCGAAEAVAAQSIAEKLFQ